MVEMNGLNWIIILIMKCVAQTNMIKPIRKIVKYQHEEYIYYLGNILFYIISKDNIA